MEHNDSLLCISNTHTDAEIAIKSLNASGIDMKKLSIVGKGYVACVTDRHKRAGDDRRNGASFR
jgi:hypothetical protein